MAPLRYLALGDSYTIGEALAVEDSWPMQWVHALRVNGTHIADPGIIARTGWTTNELSDALDEAENNGTLSPPYDLVSLSIGVNNQYRGLSTTIYRDEFTELLDRAISFSGNNPPHVFVLSIPDWGITAFGQKSGRDTAQISRELDVFNQINEDLAKSAGVHWVDISALTRKTGAAPKWYADDGLHPSRALYTLWINQLLKIKI